MLAEAGVPFSRLDAFEPDIRWPILEEIGGLTVFGGEMNVDETDRHPHLLIQRELMRRAVDAGPSMRGSIGRRSANSASTPCASPIRVSAMSC